MSLSTKTINELAKALVPEVIDYIHSDERYVEFLQTIIPESIQNKLGDIDEDLHYELSLCIIDRIFFNHSPHL